MTEAPLDTLMKYTCYDLLPMSFKVIVLDTSLLFKKALAVLLQHGNESG